MEELNLSVNEENRLLREALIRIKHLAPHTRLTVAQDIAGQAVNKCAYRDPKTGERYSNAREESTKRLHN